MAGEDPGRGQAGEQAEWTSRMDGEAGFLVFLYLNETEIRSVAALGIPFAVSALVGEKGD